MSDDVRHLSHETSTGRVHVFSATDDDGRTATMTIATKEHPMSTIDNSPLPIDPHDDDPHEAQARAERNAREGQERFDAAWREVRAQAGPHPIVRQVDARTAHFSAPGISVVFEVRHLAGVEALAAMLRAMFESRAGR